jgi:ubiquinone/menaquinone biosynthesis C-methylase UbiE
MINERDFDAAQEFLLAAKNYWTTTMYRSLRSTYLELAEEAHQSGQEHWKALEELEKTTIYRYFAWLERHLQRMKYTGRYGLIPFHSERRESLRKKIWKEYQDEFTPELNPDLPLPGYYKYVDTHQHPGGLWADEISALVYEFGARSTTPLLGDSHDELHTRFTNLLGPDKEPERILDMGCGFGKSTGPFIRRYPNAQVEGIDLSASCLMLAAQAAREGGRRNVRYRQMDAQHTRYEDESFDLVTSTMLLHEMSAKAVDQLLDECFRLLRPGGRMMHLDFYVIPDALQRFLHYGHSLRNNEPFMRDLIEMDLEQVLSDKGFEEISFEQFRESEDVDLEAYDVWRFPWTVISARKPDRQNS